MKKVIYIVSDIDKALAFEWTAGKLKDKVDLSFILIGKRKTALSDFLVENKVNVEVIADEEYPGYLKKWKRIFSIFRREQPQVVHTHLWRANLLGLSAAWCCNIKKRVLTRHHATIHYVEYPSGRKWDILCNTLATDIVAISENVKRILIERDKAKSSRIHVVYHGFDFSYFQNVDQERIDKLHAKYKLATYPVVGVISRYLKLKGIQYIIPAFRKLKKEFPDAHLVLANASGDYSKEIKKLLKQIPDEWYTEIPFEKDLAALYHIFDVFIHTPTDLHAEAFGQTYVEALITEIPSVFSMSGVAPEFIKSDWNAIVVNHEDEEGIFQGMKRALLDESLRNQLKKNGIESVKGKFELGSMVDKLVKIYIG